MGAFDGTQKLATPRLSIRQNAENAKITPALIQFSGRGQELRDVWLLARVAW